MHYDVAERGSIENIRLIFLSFASCPFFHTTYFLCNANGDNGHPGLNRAPLARTVLGRSVASRQSTEKTMMRAIRGVLRYNGNWIKPGSIVSVLTLSSLSSFSSALLFQISKEFPSQGFKLQTKTKYQRPREENNKLLFAGVQICGV